MPDWELGIRLAIVGTRTLACPGDISAAVKAIRHSLNELRPVAFISGGAEGVDSLAQTIALLFGYSEDDATMVIHRPRTKRFHGPGGYRARDTLIAEDCSHLLRLSCRQSTTYGSGWTADEAERLGRIVVRQQVCPTQ